MHAASSSPFFDQSAQYIDILIGGRQLSNILSEFSKVCVAMFLLLSGYGLNEITTSNISLASFYKKYLYRMYINYWFIGAVFVPPGVLFFNRTLESVYGHNVFLGLLLNILGIQDYFELTGYNATWWFMGAIITFYILFPWLKVIIQRYQKRALYVSFAVFFISFLPNTFRFCLFPFVLGIYASQNDLFGMARQYMSNQPLRKLAISICALVLIMLLRYYGHKLIRPVALDGAFAFLIIYIGYDYLSRFATLKQIMVIIGQHSSNIFLFHTFIYYYYFNEFSYMLRYPPLIFLQLLIICLCFSTAIEFIKKILFSRKADSNYNVQT